MADIARFSIEKLNNSNYGSWKYEVELLLRRENTWLSMATPSPTDAGKELDAWVMADGKAIGTIGLLVEKSQYVHIRPTKTAKEAWENLRAHHEKASLSNTVHMYVKLANMKLSEDGNFENLIQDVEILIDKLIAVSEPITERFRIGMMLGNLPQSYDTLITAIECRSETDLTINLVREKILNEYKRRKENAIVVNKQETAMVVRSNDRNCYFCHKPGHIKSKCFKYKTFIEKQAENEQGAKIT